MIYFNLLAILNLKQNIIIAFTTAVVDSHLNPAGELSWYMIISISLSYQHLIGLLGNIVNAIFGGKLTPENVETFSKIAILCPKNDDVDKKNEEVLQILHGHIWIYLSSDSVISDDASAIEDYPIEFLNTINPSGTAPHKLNLKIGSLIMLLRNLNTKRGLRNGTRLVVLI